MLCTQTLQTEAAQLPIGSFLSAEEPVVRLPMAADSPAAMGDLAADLFADPTNLQLNFALLKQQLAAGNYSQAMMTLDRIQILDPSSRLAKILYAELQFRLGNRAVARSMLQALINDPATPRSMRSQARAVMQLVDEKARSKPMGVTIDIARGRSGNVRAASTDKYLRYNDLLITNTTDRASAMFYDYKIEVDLVHDLMRQIPQALSVALSVDQRRYDSYRAGNSRSYAADLTYRRGINGAFTLSSRSSLTEQNGKKYNARSGLQIQFQSLLGPRNILTSSLGITRQFHFDTALTANHKDQNGHLSSASISLTTLRDSASFGVTAALADRHAKKRYFGRNTRQITAFSRFGLADWQLGLSLSRADTKYKAADPLIGSRLRRDRSLLVAAEMSRSIVRFASGGDLSLRLLAEASKTKSNIRNFTRKVNEFSIGTRIRY